VAVNVSEHVRAEGATVFIVLSGRFDLVAGGGDDRASDVRMEMRLNYV
jgi:hypothetical protein